MGARGKFGREARMQTDYVFAFGDGIIRAQSHILQSLSLVINRSVICDHTARRSLNIRAED